MLSSFVWRFKVYNTAYYAVILGWYQLEASRFKFDDTEFTLINARNTDHVYVLFLENESEILNQITKEQQITKLWYPVIQTPEPNEEKLASLCWNFISHLKLYTWVYHANICFQHSNELGGTETVDKEPAR